MAVKFGNVKIDKCPKCASDDIKVHDSTFSPKGFSCTVTCIKCGHSEKLDG